MHLHNTISRKEFPMKKLLFTSLSLLTVLLTVSFSNDAFAKVIVTKVSGVQNPLVNMVFEAQPKNISVRPSDNLIVNPTSTTDIWYINCKTGKVTDLWIQIEGDLLSLGIARGPDCPDVLFEVYQDQKVHFVGTIRGINGTVLIVASKNGGSIKATSDKAQVEAVKQWATQVFSVLVNKFTLSQNITFELSTIPAQKIVCSWPGTYFPFTSFGYRELLEGGLLVVDVFNVPLAPPKSGEMPIFTDFGRIKMANPSHQTTAWGFLKKGDSK